jgi:hypothetical protein
VHLVDPISELVASTTGPQPTLVILVNFSTNPVQTTTPAGALDVLAQVNQHYDLGSRHHTNLVPTVTGWHTVTLTPSIACDYLQISALADAAATAAGVDLASYTRKVYAFPQYAGCAWWGLGTVGGSPSRAWINGSFQMFVVGHEMGHNLGQYHASALDCGTVAVGPTCTKIEYGDPWDLMAQSNPGNFGIVGASRIGWLDAPGLPPLTTVTATGTYSITALEAQDDGPKGLKVLASTATSGERTYYYLETRQPIGNDAFLAGIPESAGVLVSTIAEFSSQNLLLDMRPTTDSWTDAALPVGATWVDPNGVSLQVLAAGAAGATIVVAYGIPPPPPPTPQPHTVIFTALGLPAALSVIVDYAGTTDLGDPQSGAFRVPPSAALVVRAGSVVTYHFTEMVKKGNKRYRLISATPATGFVAGAVNGTTTVTAVYAR